MVDIIVKPGHQIADNMTINQDDRLILEANAVSVYNTLNGGKIDLNAGSNLLNLKLDSGVLSGFGDFTQINNLKMTGGRFETIDKMFFYNQINITGGTVVTPGYYQTNQPIFFFDENTSLNITGGTVYLPHGQPADWDKTGKPLPITLKSPAVLEINSKDLANYEFNVPDGDNFCINLTDLNNAVGQIKDVVNVDGGIAIKYLDGSSINLRGHFPEVYWSSNGVNGSLELFTRKIDLEMRQWDPQANGLTLYTGDRITFYSGSRGGDTDRNYVEGGEIQLVEGFYVKNTTLNSGLIYSAGDGGQLDGLIINGGKFEVGKDIFFSGDIVINGGKVDTFNYGGDTHPTFRYDAGTRFIITGGEVLLPVGRPINGFTGKLKITLKSPAHFQAYSQDLSNYYFDVPSGDGFRIDLIDLKNGALSIRSVTNVSDGLLITKNDGTYIKIYGNFPEASWGIDGRDGGIDIYAGSFDDIVPVASNIGSNRVLSNGDIINIASGAGGEFNRLVGGKILLGDHAYLSHTSIESGEVTMIAGGATIDWLTMRGGTLNIASGSSIYGNVVITGGTINTNPTSSADHPIFYYNAGTILTIIGGDVTLPSARPVDNNAGPLRVTMRAPAIFKVYSDDLKNYIFDVPDGSFRIDLLDQQYSKSSITRVSNTADGLVIHYSDGHSVTIYGNFSKAAGWTIGSDGVVELYAGHLDIIVRNPGETTGSHLILNTDDKVTFMPGTGGDHDTLNGGVIQLNSHVVLADTTMNSGHIYSAGPGPIIDRFTMNGGKLEVRDQTNFYGNIIIRGGKVDTYGYGQGADPVFYYDQYSKFTITGGEVLLPIAQPVNDKAGKLKIELGPNAQFEVYSKSLENLYFEVTGDDFRLDIMDLKFYSGRVINITKTALGFRINLVDGSHINLYGNFGGMKWRNGGRDGSIELYACFAQGTLISTPVGKRLVETLKVGDCVETATGVEVITWIGHKTVNLHGPVADECLLVKVKRGAFADNSPSRDLWLTSEHCVVVSGGLVPIRCLVNDVSITYDRERRHYTYYNFTLAEHGIVYAEDLPAETYRPSYERQHFDTPAPTRHVTADASKQPYLDTPSKIKAAWHALAQRANLTSIIPLGPGKRLVKIVTDNGEKASLLGHKGNRVRFSVPSGAKYIVVESESSRPDHDIGPYVDDRRTLGVRVGIVIVKEQGKARTVNSHLSSNTLPGWNNIEDGLSRWTSGKGTIPIKAFGRAQQQFEIEVEFPDSHQVHFSSEPVDQR